MNAAGEFTRYIVWIVEASCFSDPDGDSLTIFANQPADGSITAATSSDCDSGQVCWWYYPPGGWDGTAYNTSFTFYARDPDGATSATGRFNLCVNC